jgi:CelD/BcsL family acetyltransferase involved in cellulose biosynthesis
MAEMGGSAAVGTMRRMPVDWTDDPTAFVGRDWTSLAETDPEGTIFHTPSYLKPYWEEFGTSGLQLAFVLEGGEAISVTAFEFSQGSVTFLGGSEITDYMGPVGVPELRDRAAKELMAALAARDDWDTADLRGLLETSGWHRALHRGARDAALWVESRDDGVAPLLGLPGSFDAYLAGLPAKLRHETRRKRRRLHKAFPSAHLVDATPETMGADFGRFVELHRSSSGSKGKFMYPGMELFFRRLGEELLPLGVLRLIFLEAEGEKIAGAVGFRDRQRLRLYNSAYDHARAALSPGIVLLNMLIEDLIAEGGEALDLLKGDEEYKRRLGATPRRLARLVLRRG